MAFTTFIDDLAVIQVLLLLAAAVIAYAGVLAWWAIYTNDAKALRAVLRGMSVPLGITGIAATILALWGEMTWPFLISDGLGGYNIFFFDALLLFGLVLLALAFSAYSSMKLQYAGLFAFVIGAVVMFYGWTGYTATTPFTKDPFDTLLLYFAFGGVGIFAFPATVLIDHFLKASDEGRRPAWAPRAEPPQGSEAASAPSWATKLPHWVSVVLWLLPIVAALAAIAAGGYFVSTLPGHLGGGPATPP